MSKLVKCSKGKLFGVCCGISKALGLDVTIVRLLFILGAIFTGSALLWIYLLLALILPSED